MNVKAIPAEALKAYADHVAYALKTIKDVDKNYRL